MSQAEYTPSKSLITQIEKEIQILEIKKSSLEKDMRPLQEALDTINARLDSLRSYSDPDAGKSQTQKLKNRIVVILQAYPDGLTPKKVLDVFIKDDIKFRVTHSAICQTLWRNSHIFEKVERGVYKLRSINGDNSENSL